MNRRRALVPENFRPLNPSDFVFHGFGDGLARLEERIGQLGIRDGEPWVETVEDAVFVPSGATRGPGRSHTSGVIIAADGQPVDAARVRRKGGKLPRRQGEPVAVEPRREVDEPVVYLGPLFNHYGRLLLESLARVWFLAEADPSVRVVFDYTNAAERTQAPWALRILDAFGIPAERLLVLDTPTRLRRVMIPEALFEQGNAAHEAMVRPFREVAARVADGVDRTEQPVYLSRRLLTSLQRPIVGEEELEDVLRENGFLVVYPETMDFADQVRLFNRHVHVVSSVDCAAHTLLFARTRPELHLLTIEHTASNYFLCSALAEAPTTFVNCLGTGHREDYTAERDTGEGRRRGGDRSATLAIGPQATPQLIELPTLMAYLDQRGFLTRRLRAPLAGRDPALRQRYDEAWVFGRIRKAIKQGLALPAEVETEAMQVAQGSWPVSAALARYYAETRQDPEQMVEMACLLADLLSAESEMNRLAHYRAEVEGLVMRVIGLCRSDVAVRLAETVADRFGTEAASADEGDVTARLRRRAARRDGRGQPPRPHGEETASATAPPD
ncbi:MAG: glycosyltransferase family 61 protein [Chloroflexia bacterium]|nr:glycosyltransferase family 61 protein [Chloroflexia bacterium]